MKTSFSPIRFASCLAVLAVLAALYRWGFLPLIDDQGVVVGLSWGKIVTLSLIALIFSGAMSRVKS